MLRSALHLALAAALLVSFAQAPFGHFHERDLGHQHGHGGQHAHWAEAPLPPLSLDHADAAEACFREWLAGDQVAPAQLLIELPSTAFGVSLRTVAFVTPPPARRSHDPPRLYGPPARSPTA